MVNIFVFFFLLLLLIIIIFIIIKRLLLFLLSLYIKPSLPSCQDGTCAKESDIDSNLLQLLFDTPTRCTVFFF